MPRVRIQADWGRTSGGTSRLTRPSDQADLNATGTGRERAFTRRKGRGLKAGEEKKPAVEAQKRNVRDLIYGRNDLSLGALTLRRHD